MHVAIVTPFVSSPRHIDGGVAGVSKYLTDELAQKSDIELTVVVPKGVRGKTVRERWENFDVYKAGVKNIFRFLPGTIYDILIGKRQIRSLLKRIDPDIVHFQGATFLAANCKRPNILTIHGIVERDAIWDMRRGILRWPKSLLLKLTENYGRRRVPHIILISEYVKKFLPGRNRIKKTWLIENPIADSYFDVDWQPEQGRIFCCGRVVPLKNILGLIKAFALLSNRFPDSQLRIAGSLSIIPKYVEKCRRLVDDNDLSDRVHFLGALSIDAVQTELSKCNCLAIPSFQETAPLSVEEAMAAGVPVVGSNLCGLPYLIEEGKTGYLIDPHNMGKIAEGLGKIIEDPSLAHSMSRRAREIARKRFLASVIAKRTLDVYHEILEIGRTCADR